ncbi:acetoacetyl-CoA synthetase-like, partial [Notechis scutatus]|uniref:Acetoacetyl-CoA synthetase-like n=1 Tax=Notechis scutatus TaxID=8663 RepID=A0A6J1W859_9SAUR
TVKQYLNQEEGAIILLFDFIFFQPGEPVWGESGELVCTKPMPCQPTHFWNDENGNKYRKAYFSRFSGVWAHGDYCKINPQTGGIVMLGRSDGTLNPSGVRFGSSEIYNIGKRNLISVSPSRLG